MIGNVLLVSDQVIGVNDKEAKRYLATSQMILFTHIFFELSLIIIYLKI